MLKLFILGTLVSFVPIIYLGAAQETTVIPRYHTLVMYFPLVYGILTVLIGKSGNWLMGGALAGLLLSMMGKRMGIPKLLFPELDNYRVHVIAMVLYALVYSVIIKRLYGTLKCV